MEEKLTKAILQWDALGNCFHSKPQVNSSLTRETHEYTNETTKIKGVRPLLRDMYTTIWPLIAEIVSRRGSSSFTPRQHRQATI